MNIISFSTKIFYKQLKVVIIQILLEHNNTNSI